MTTPALQLSSQDNIAVALSTIAADTELLSTGGLKAINAIPSGHKVALSEIPQGQAVIKYGQVIGLSSCDIKAGEHVHSHNMSFSKSQVEIEHRESDNNSSNDMPPLLTGRTFEGFERDYCKGVGTRNIVAVVATVSCANSVVRAISQNLQLTLSRDFPNVDAVIPLCHGGGCAVNQDGISLEILQRTLKGWVQHPNIAAVLLVSLGCETNQVEQFLPEVDDHLNERIRSIGIQNSGGTAKAIHQGIAIGTELLSLASNAKRQSQPLSKLSLALQCGGSDGFSGISANPALGRAVDILSKQGARAILAETPEIFGAEHLLYSRCKNQATAQALEQKVLWWEQYAQQQGETLNSNPSHGNKQGGISTIVEKSLGAVAKGGSNSINAVYEYAATMNTEGLVFMDSPGYDPVSITGQIASGANIICFTTGRGSNFNSPAAPSLKIASNSRIFNRMPDDLDINAGQLIDGDVTLDQFALEIVERIIATASGELSKGETLGLIEDGFHPWSLGAVL